jgi:uncharacterized damage-inducible protein DinB
MLHQQQLLANLTTEVTDTLQLIQSLNPADTALNQPPAPGKWSIAQIIAHLNTYNRYYLPLIAANLKQSANKPAPEYYKPGWLGNYFTKSMYSEVVTDKKVTNKMNAMKDHTPTSSVHYHNEATEFSQHLTHMLQLLQQMSTTNIGTTRIPITITKLITLKTGDAMRFLVAHQVRHTLQMRNTLAALGK